MITITIDGPTAKAAESVLNKTLMALKDQGVDVTFVFIRPGDEPAEHRVGVEHSDKVSATVSVPWNGSVDL
jgi:hypothetical protein